MLPHLLYSVTSPMETVIKEIKTETTARAWNWAPSSKLAMFAHDFIYVFMYVYTHTIQKKP
jgi:hypothetical protein